MDVYQKEYNVLLLGETQSGKSTLVEALRLYADPAYQINTDIIGNGIFSQTADVTTATIHTDLPSYFIADKAGKPVDHCIFLEEDQQEDYVDELNERRKYVLERGEPTTVTATFNLIDTPGLNDTGKFDESNLAVIFRALEGIKTVHLVVITVANNPFTEGLQNALKAYVDLFPEFQGNIVFLHTRIDYGKLHHTDHRFIASFKEKKKTLHDLAGRSTIPHLLIDNDLGSTRTIRNCITKNTLRELLAMAKLNQPVPFQIMVVNKTARMQVADNILKDKYQKIIAKREATLGFKDRTKKKVLETINELRARIHKCEQHCKDIERDRKFHDRDRLVVIYERRCDKNWRWLKLAESTKTQMSYPDKQTATAPGFIRYVIDHVDTQAHNVDILKQEGGKGHQSWSVKFHRNRFQNGIFHAKIYIQMRRKFVELINNLKNEEKVAQEELANYHRDLEKYEQAEKNVARDMDGLLNDLKMDRYLLSRVSMSKLESTIFYALVEAQVFVHQDSETAANLERYYKENRDKLEKEDSRKTFSDASPVNNTEETKDGCHACQMEE